MPGTDIATGAEPQAEHRVAIFGAGAVGGYLGARLANSDRAASWPVTLIGRPKIVDAVHARGLTLIEAGARQNALVAAALPDDDLGSFDIVLLCVRAYDVQDSVPDLSRLLGDSGLVVAMQNGVGSEDPLVEAFGIGRVFPATLTASVGVEEPGVIARYSRQGGLAVASLQGNRVPDSIVELLYETGLEFAVLNDYRSLRWSKLLLNMIGAATSAILDIDIAEIVGDPKLFRLEQLAFREAMRAMDVNQIETVNLPGYRVRMARLAMRLPTSVAQRLLGPRIVRARGGRSPNTRTDMARGKTEVRFFNGAVVEASERAGIEAPVNRVLTQLTLDLAADPSRREQFRGKPQKLWAYLAARGVAL